MNLALLVIAKQPVPGQVKTRLCPPCTPEQAAAVAWAALLDTLDAVSHTPAVSRTLVISGRHTPPAGWRLVTQRGVGLAERLAHAYVDVPPGDGSLLIGMDTPQVTPEILGELGSALRSVDAVIAPAEDGGWWALGLRDPKQATVLRTVPMSTSDTCRLTIAALRSRGLRIAVGRTLRDVDTAEDALVVARSAPGRRFAETVRCQVPSIGASI